LPEKPLDPNGSFIYRGQSDADWKLIPLIWRKDNRVRKLLGNDFTLGKQVALEKSVLNCFVENCDLPGLRIPNDSFENRRHHIEPNSGYYSIASTWPQDGYIIELMALAQHYGVPTLLLDWSKRSFVAAYFAASDALSRGAWLTDSKIAIWALNISNFSGKMKILKVPGSTSINLAAQFGLFTLADTIQNDNETFELKCLTDFTNRNRFWKINLPASFAPDVINLCGKYGVSASTLFPSFNGVGRAVFDTIEVSLSEDSATEKEVKSSNYEEDKKNEMKEGYEYWKSISNMKSMAFVNEVIESVGETNTNITYLKSYIALGTNGKYYAWFAPRRSEGMCYIMIRVSKSKINDARSVLKIADIMHYVENEDIVIPSQRNVTDNEGNKDIIKKIIKDACDFAKSNK
jgi:hypothetical protein